MSDDPSQSLVRVARNAMATRFEIALHSKERRPDALRAAAEEALTEVERIEDQLSLYRPHSEIAQVNARAAWAPVRVSPPVFRLLQKAAQFTLQSQGAFDITVAPLVKCWGFMAGQGAMPDPEALRQARESVGMDGLELDVDAMTVRFLKPGMMLDLGAIGKGYAIDSAIEVLKEAGIEDALVHGGTSTVYGLGVEPDGRPWRVGVDLMPVLTSDAASQPIRTRAGVVELSNQALSVSAVWGKSFQSRERRLGHVLDPRTGEPVTHTQLAAVSLSSATATDALSTALLTLGRGGVEGLAQGFPEWRSLVMDETGQVTVAGMEVHD